MSFRKLILLVSLPLYVVDQLSKFWTIRTFPHHLLPHDKDIAVIENVLHFTRVHNQGVAFGIGNGSDWAPIVFLFVPILALLMLKIFWAKGVFQHPISHISVALLLSGIFGNLTDRLVQGFLLEPYKDCSFWTRLSEGYVVDFISVKIPFYEILSPASNGWWPTFNIADSCICVAAILLFISGILEEAAQKKSKKTH
jgi:signal peptidase II